MQLRLTDVVFSYPLRDGRLHRALDEVNLMLGDGECLGVIGPEGAGKTTLLYVMDMLLTPGKGSLHIDGLNVWEEKSMATVFRRRIGMQFQFPEQQFVAGSVEEELLFGVARSNSQNSVPAGAALLAVGLDADRFLRRSPFDLSVGEARRVALASLLIKSPELLLLDEPTVGLDGPGKTEFIHSLRAQQTLGTTLAIVSHDLDFLAEVATSIVVLMEGRVVGSGLVGSVLQDSTLLNLAGYDQPELIRILEALTEKKVISPGTFLRPEEIACLPVRGSS